MYSVHWKGGKPVMHWFGARTLIRLERRRRVRPGRLESVPAAREARHVA